MPVTTSYPGIYIEELPGPPPTIAAAPTSITVFVGYTHPYKTQNFSTAVQIFSYAAYTQAFGDIYSNSALDAQTAYAVQQFFLNGGTGLNAYVLGLRAADFAGWTLPQLPLPLSPQPVPAQNFSPSLGTPPGGGPKGTLQFSGTDAVIFSGLEPIDPQNYPMTVTVTNFISSTSSAQLDAFDVTITYGSTPYGSLTSGTTTETFRRVSLFPSTTLATGPKAGQLIPNPNFIETRINGNSRLIWVSTPTPQTPYNVFPPATGQQPIQVIVNSALNSAGNPAEEVLNAADFAPAFAANGPIDQIPIFNLMVIPGITDADVIDATGTGVWEQATAFCELKRAFLICDPPQNCIANGPAPQGSQTIQDYINSGLAPQSINAALYFPWLTLPVIDPLSGNNVQVPPSGTVAGIFAKIDGTRGVWKAPAGLETTITNVVGVVPSGVLTDNQQGVLNPLGVNCLRAFPGSNTVVFGARTTTTADPSFQQWRYVPVRRMALFIEQSLYAALGWVVFEPNDTPLWTAITTSVNAFMLTLFHQGAFQGAKASDAFQVVCDSTTTTQTDINNGIVNILVAFAPLKPAEFVVIQIAQLAGQASS
jgi:uncharacterized protein